MEILIILFAGLNTAPVPLAEQSAGSPISKAADLDGSHGGRHSRGLRVRKPARQQVWKPNVTRISLS